ncbi:class I tRNA ligase family protein, partial [Candidatus Peregrinibacteria bacterium]|nr:class I tRNA ligase family protein [Candidatus Peregrinibacteria bacterium]
MSKYDPSTVEPKWQKKWEEARVYHIDLAKTRKPHYCLVMFPYPSGARLHVGHWFQYGPTDSYARFLHMRGHGVFFPMGFDAFGLPAENFAIKTGTPPAESTAQNTVNMIEQFRRMGCMYDWSKSLNTSDPSYYRWTQWLFLQMFEHGLAYKKEAPVNFCPQCQTVL